MDFNNKKRKGGVALASHRLGRVEKGQPLILGANKLEGGRRNAKESARSFLSSFCFTFGTDLPAICIPP